MIFDGLGCSVKRFVFNPVELYQLRTVILETLFVQKEIWNILFFSIKITRKIELILLLIYMLQTIEIKGNWKC